MIMRGETERMVRICDEVQTIVEREGLGDFAQHVLVNNWRGRAHTRAGDFETGCRLTKLATTGWREAEAKICIALFWGGEAKALGAVGRTSEALELMDAVIAHCRDTGDRYMEREVLRLRAELMLADGSFEADSVEGTLIEARDLLAPVYDRFTEGFETRDLREAKALLETLS